ncbi:MAG: ABC transporter permease [Candidatus Thermoplasmatota archaeon]
MRGGRGSKALRRYGALLSIGWKALRQSRLGMIGIGLIVAFGMMALLAPFISPFTPEYLAPDEDVFELKIYHKTFPQGAYLEPVLGPTTPQYVNRNGGIWHILPVEEGHIYMDFMESALVSEATPFEIGNISIEVNITALGLEPPLQHLLYLCPGVDSAGNFRGDPKRNGLLGIVANETFAVIDPFLYPSEDCVLYRVELGFAPRWLVQDPLSAGEMYDIPSQREYYVGVIPFKEGPYRYVVAADEHRAVVYRLEYLWNEQGLRSAEVVLDLNMTISQEPLAYLNKDFPEASGILLPGEGNITFFDMKGGVKCVMNLTLSGAPASPGAPMGYSRVSFPPYVFAPVQGEAGDGVVFISMANISVIHVFDPGIEGSVVGCSPSKGQSLHILYNFQERKGGVYARVYRVSYGEGSIGAVDEGFNGDLVEHGSRIFYVTEVSKVFVLGESGRIYAGITTVGGSTRQGMQIFFDTEAGTRFISDVGSLSGTRYGTLSSNEVHGLYFDAVKGETTIFQFIGSTRAPLSPGTYPSGNTYYLGTDSVGHDILTHLIYGSQIAFLVGILSALITVVMGTLIGLISGYYGGLLDTLLMRLTDIVLVIPGLPIILIAIQIWGPSIWTIIILLSVLSWPGIARVIRAQTLSLKERPFIDAARIGGSSDMRIILRHLAPNVLPFTFLYMTLIVAGAIITEAALSFLALGDPKVVSWGQMLSTIQTSGNTLSAWWWLLPPGVSITLLSLGFYLVGRAVDEIVNPRLRRR